ncbi:TIGR04500 family putative peptide maturation system protein [Nonomuraea sp. NPDC050663]|uniref:TIGR04500 family putative peptide maturation system protein n=1 Tax=Nonomuraea sp. NPDC050663 TaxID=3364370 RepID=UPI00378AEB00
MNLGEVLGDAVELLGTLTRRRQAAGAAREAAVAWAERHPGYGAELVVAERPGSPLVDYDLLLDWPGRGTIAVSVQPDDGLPWLEDHSTHWAAGQLVTVDGADLSLPDALLMLRSLTRPGLDPHAEIVELCLTRNDASSDTEPLSEEELQATADAFRRARGLHDREATLHWLAAMGMDQAAFADHLEVLARQRRLRRRKESELAAGYLAAHPEEFGTVRASWVWSPSPWPQGAPLPEPVEVPAGALPQPLRSADRVEAARHEDGFVTGVVHERLPARADEHTLAAAGRAAYAGWLAGRRAAADVRWHWL